VAAVTVAELLHAPTPTFAPTSINLLTPDVAPGASLQLLRAFDLRADGVSVSLPASAQRLLAFLALHDRPLQRGYVAGSLWLDTTDDRASANLRSTLWRLRKPGFDTIESTPTHLRLAPNVRVDLHELSNIAHGLIDSTCTIDPATLTPSLVASLSFDLLPDWLDDDFILVEQERWRQLRIHALEAVVSRLGEASRFGEAVDAALAAVAAEPLRESAHRVLIQVHLAEGNTSEAVRGYESFRALLERELGLTPSPAMESLVGGLTRP
jgi:DNA-binding SARP family transcriptional activator